MKILIDECITPKLETELSNLGYDTKHIINMGLSSIPDEKVFEIAKEQKRILVTCNGKDFIVYVPPKKEGVSHSGIIWCKIKITRVRANIVCETIHKLLKDRCNLDGEIWVLRQDINLNYICMQKH